MSPMSAIVDFISKLESIRHVQLVYDRSKTALFWFILFHYLLQAQRHLWARGIRQTILETWRSMISVRLFPIWIENAN
jgi:hypothetical protein